ncbi:MBL fold metallo-hydrolase [Aureivirga marina]|uniref:MBL fold metallo-hydrolase n=1 Tax=Aureivirga marina TaxID=1182451 RepID=UPI0018C9F0A5|nr:MBL fold metallo-hydrolase [Aureivirga marina]
MKVQQIFTGCLAEMAYYIESNGEAAIIDPLRETQPYLDLAEKDGAKIKYIFLTHFHADFVSGQVDLAKKTGATIVFGPNANPNYEIHQGTDNEEFIIGNGKIKLLHTPGHTMESSSYLLIDEEEKMPCVFTGDCLFIGDVGRPDLAVKSDLSEADLAGHLFDSLRNKIMTLPDDIIIYPNHGAGSACGKNMSKETFDTLGNQKKTNYALREDMTKEEFIKEVTDGLTTPPQYFPNNVKMNKQVNTEFDEIVNKGTTPLSVKEFNDLANQDDVLVIDTRSKSAYTDEGTIPGAWYFGIDGGFAPWIGALIKDIDQKIIFLAEEGREKEVVTRLSRVGYDHSLGYLKRGLQAWIDAGLEVDKIGSISAEEFKENLTNNSMEVPMDVRKPNEFNSEHVLGVSSFPLDFIHATIDDLDKNRNYFVHCQSGYRSLIASSIMKSKGIKNVTDVRGGFKALKACGAKTSDFVCPSTM